MREVRHLDALLTPNRLSEEPELSLAEAPHAGLVAGYRAARVAMARTAVALANARRRAWSGRVEKQISRMSAYYAQLRREAQSQVGRGRDVNRERDEVVTFESVRRIAGDVNVGRRRATDSPLP